LTIARTFNEYGDVIDFFVISDAGKMIPRKNTNINTKYDNQGNWIQKITFKKRATDEFYPIEIMEREITYYTPTS